ncbi:MAG: InlB B-repeat-containing protein [Oscillospiraceae bacterium]|nr:InlB B-repeat-containing protein [Oscillospiraceae bacterium]MBR6954489.1 InlB B-repeat-containing protein [Clostridia bacterium]
MESNGRITIDGGTYLINNIDGAGIGSADRSSSGEEIVINGGNVSVNVLGKNGAGIGSGATQSGGGRSFGSVLINGGDVTVHQMEAERDTSSDEHRAHALGNSAGDYNSYQGGKIYDAIGIADNMRLTIRTRSNKTDHVETSIKEVISKAYYVHAEPCPHERYGYTFTGWYQVVDGVVSGTPFDFDTAVTGPIELRAGWQVVTEHTVTFDPDGGSEVAAQRVLSGETAVVPEAPVKAGYTFVGWYLTDGTEVAETPFDFTTPILETTVLKAVWREVITVTLLPGDGTGEAVVISSADEAGWSETPEAGKFCRNSSGVQFMMPGMPETFTPPEGLSFDGWQAEGRDLLMEAGWPLLPLDQDAYTLTAQWSRHYSITWAEMAVDASWMSTEVTEAPAGKTVDVMVLLSETLYDGGNGLRLQSLTLTGEGMDPVTITTDRHGETLAFLTPIDAKNGSVLYFSPSFTMPAADVTVTANFRAFTPWALLQERVNAGGTVTLEQDYTASASDAALTIPEGVTVTLDLQGHTLSRGKSGAVKNGNVITVEGTLVLEDSAGGGTITGGYNQGSGGGVRVLGNLTMNGGTITGNQASSGSSIPAVGGGVYVMGTASVNGGVITGNTVKGVANNLYLPQGKTIAVGETVLPGSQISVTTETAPTATAPVAFTGGPVGGNTACFSSDAGYALGTRNGRACLVTLAEFAPNFTLPTGLTEIEAEAFEGAAMTMVSVPADCTAIGDRAFADCPNLTQIFITPNVTLGEDVFDGCGLVYDAVNKKQARSPARKNQTAGLQRVYPSIKICFFSGTFGASFLGIIRLSTPFSNLAFMSSSVMLSPT